MHSSIFLSLKLDDDAISSLCWSELANYWAECNMNMMMNMMAIIMVMMMLLKVIMMMMMTLFTASVGQSLLAMGQSVICQPASFTISHSGLSS